MALLGGLLRKALLQQASCELGAFGLYKEAAYWFEAKHLKRIAKKLNEEAEEEKNHFDEILSYVTERGDTVEVIFPEMPQKDWKSEKCVIEFLYQLEKDNYKNYYELFKLARDNADYDLEGFLAKHLREQVKSVDEWEGRLCKVNSFSAIPGLIWHLDATF